MGGSAGCVVVRTRRSSGLRLLLAKTLVLVLALAGLMAPARGDDFEAAVAGLAASGFPQKVEAVAAIAALGDARGRAVLEALQDGRLYARGGVLIEKVDDSTAREVLSAAATSVSGAKKVTLNNQLRVALESALSALNLGAGTPSQRLEALQSWIENPPDALPASLRELAAAESDSELRMAMELVIALVDARSGTDAERLAAVEILAGSMRPEARNRLQGLATDTAEDSTVRSAAAKAVASIDLQRLAYGMLETAYFGLSLGSVLALCAIGLAVTFGVMGVINMAHGEMMMLGAYTTYVVQQAFPNAIGWSLLIAMPLAFLVTAVVGVAIERGIVSRLYGRPLETLLATFGVSLFLQQVVRSYFGATNQAVQAPSWMSGSFELLEGLAFTWNRLYIMVFSLLVFLALMLLLRATDWGLQIRAVSQNRHMARALGVSSLRVNALTFGLGSGIAGLAGVALSQLTNVGPNLGQSYIVDAFMVVVFGGVGSVWGTLVAGLSLGMVNKLLEPVTGAVLAKVLVLVVIILFIQRFPRGLFPLRGRAAEG
jgi:urea transport system permease protein